MGPLALAFAAEGAHSLLHQLRKCALVYLVLARRHVEVAVTELVILLCGVLVERSFVVVLLHEVVAHLLLALVGVCAQTLVFFGSLGIGHLPSPFDLSLFLLKLRPLAIVELESHELTALPLFSGQLGLCLHVVLLLIDWKHLLIGVILVLLVLLTSVFHLILLNRHLNLLLIILAHLMCHFLLQHAVFSFLFGVALDPSYFGSHRARNKDGPLSESLLDQLVLLVAFRGGLLVLGVLLLWLGALAFITIRVVLLPTIYLSDHYWFHF